MNDFEVKDNGDRMKFESGMVRDTAQGKPRFDLVIPENVPFDQQLLTRIAMLYMKGSIKYAERNWEQAVGAEELTRFKASAFRHFMQWFCGEEDEDHAAMTFFNIQGVETVKHKMKQREACD